MGPRGLHHVTGITGDVQANVDFYVGLLGLHLVKRTVNHQDPSTLHLFYGDSQGRPGTVLTFFAWPDTALGRRGIGQAAEVGLMVPREEIGYWYERLLSRGVRFGGPSAKGGLTTLSLEDPDGLPVVLVGVEDAPPSPPLPEQQDESRPPDGPPPAADDVGADAAVRGLHHVTLWSDQLDATGEVLTELLGFTAAGEADSLRTYRTDAPVGHTVYVRDASGFWPSAGGAGTLHHVGFRRDMEDFPERMREYSTRRLLETSPRREHGYFESRYFREPSGAIIEVASDAPGFTLDEPHASLGDRLVLPEDLEPRRAEIEAVLPSFVLPGEPRPPRRDLGLVHRRVSGSSATTLLLLHGPGGDETTLLPLAREVAPDANLLSVRGHLFDGGRPHFVKRAPGGEPDTEELSLAADGLASFTADAVENYDIDPAGVILVGHGDGANLALASLVRHPGSFAGAALFRPGVAPSEEPHGGLEGKPVLVVLGTDDAAIAEGEAAAAYLSTAGAAVEVTRVPLGALLWDPDTEALGSWLVSVAGPA